MAALPCLDPLKLPVSKLDRWQVGWTLNQFPRTGSSITHTLPIYRYHSSIPESIHLSTYRMTPRKFSTCGRAAEVDNLSRICRIIEGCETREGSLHGLIRSHSIIFFPFLSSILSVESEMQRSINLQNRLYTCKSEKRNRRWRNAHFWSQWSSVWCCLCHMW